MPGKPVAARTIKYWIDNPTQKIRIYTFQHPNILKDLETKGFLTGNPKFAFPDQELSDAFLGPYQWITKQMQDKINNYSGDLPIWAWPKRPNNRFIKKCYHGPTIRITADIPFNRILASDFDLWHAVLNNCMIYNNQEQMDYFDLNEPADQLKEQSWGQIFDILHEKSEFEKYWWGNKQRTIQLCIDRIYPQEISSIKTY